MNRLAHAQREPRFTSISVVSPYSYIWCLVYLCTKMPETHQSTKIFIQKMIEEQRKNKYKDCKIWVKQVYSVLHVIVDSRKVFGSMTLWKIFGMHFISCSSLSLWTVQLWTRDLSPQDREGRFIHLERTGSERCISIKKAEERRVGVSWRKNNELWDQEMREV